MKKLKELVEHFNEMKNTRAWLWPKEGESERDTFHRYAKWKATKELVGAPEEVVQLSRESSLTGQAYDVAKKVYDVDAWTMDHRIRVAEECIDGFINTSNFRGKGDRQYSGGHSRELNDKCFKWLGKFEGDRNKFKQ